MGPSHSTIDRIWTGEDAVEYLGDGNKADKVMTGLKTLRDGGQPVAGGLVLPPDHDKLHRVAAELADLLIGLDLVKPADVQDVQSLSPAAALAPGVVPPSAIAPAVPVPVPAPTRAASDINPQHVMVVHGQDTDAARALFDWLRSIGLRPSEWSALVKASSSGSPFIGEVLNAAFARAQAVVVLFTPDEQVRLRPGLKRDTWHMQARPNVLFEAGMAFASHPDRTVIVVLGDQEIPSDLAGRHYVRIDGPASLRDLALRLETAGCAVDLDGSDWLDVSRFPDRSGIDASPTAGA